MSEHTLSNPAPTIHADDWAAQNKLHQRLLAATREVNRAVLFATLADARIDHVIVSFDGYGDSGQIENIEAKAGDSVVQLPSTQIDWTSPVWGKTESERSRMAMREAIEALTYACLEETHMGWENNDGSYGDFIFDVAKRTITLDYNERYTACDHSHHVF